MERRCRPAIHVAAAASQIAATALALARNACADRLVRLRGAWPCRIVPVIFRHEPLRAKGPVVGPLLPGGACAAPSGAFPRVEVRKETSAGQGRASSCGRASKTRHRADTDAASAVADSRSRKPVAGTFGDAALASAFTTIWKRGRSSTRLRIRPWRAGRRNASRSQRARCPRSGSQRACAAPAETRSRCSFCLAFSPACFRSHESPHRMRASMSATSYRFVQPNARILALRMWHSSPAPMSE